MAARGLLAGTVTAFDVEVGLGTVRGADGVELAFHATAIADGSRTILVGATVLYSVAPGHMGTTDARPVAAV